MMKLAGIRLWEFSQAILEMMIGLAFVLSGLIHLTNLFAFYEAILAYRILDGVSAQGAAQFLPFLSIAIGLSLCLGLCVNSGRLLAFVMLYIFATAQGIVMLRGEQISCGCFGSYSHNINVMSIIGLTVAGSLCYTRWACRCRQTVLRKMLPIDHHANRLGKSRSI